nr:MAG TPA_asm: hypothetical protein [Caudoviricetes sp.]
MRLGRVDIPDDRFRGVCDMGAAAVGILTVLCAAADESGMVVTTATRIAEALKMRRASVYGLVRCIAAAGIAKVEVRQKVGMMIAFQGVAEEKVHLGTISEEKVHLGTISGGTNFSRTSTTHTNIINNNTNNIIKSNSVTNNAYACTREEAPVERMDMEDREEAARLKGGLGYPATWQEVREAAVAYAIDMKQDEAEGFLAKYAAVGWVRSGARIRDWRYLIPAWHNNWQQVELDKKARRTTHGNRCDDRGNAGSTGGDCWGQARFSGHYGPATTEEEFLRMLGDDD